MAVNASDNGTGGQQVAPLASPVMPADPRTLKSRIFSASNKRLKSEIVEFFGEKIEIRQSTVGRMFDSRKQLEGEDVAHGIFILMNYAYVPGTDIPVFDEADADQILSLPFGEDMSRVFAAFNKINGMDIAAEEKNSVTTNSVSR